MPEDRRLQHEYRTAAGRYDRRWRHYLEASLHETLTRLPLDGGEAVLDAGCGTGVLLRRLRVAFPGLSLTGVDPSDAMLAVAAARLAGGARLVQGRAQNLPFVDASFDVVTCTSVLHYWPDPGAALAEIRRMLAPGGRLALTDWCGDYAGIRLLSAWLRLTGRSVADVHGRAAVRRLLQDAGFRVTRLDRYRIGWRWGMMTAVAQATDCSSNSLSPAGRGLG